MTLISTSVVPISTNFTPNDSCGFEYAPSVIEADRSLTSNKGIKEPPLKPVAELESGFLMSAVSAAVFGIEAESPKSTVAVP